ncbi:hypothetical protein [Streptomyces sp. NBC_01497]|uniref:hypothetical protein n=1 Tax=Streptomyces sp. NBC_01497 TaxID=2903885 RepID=UPI002E34863D|nr:hypothetical protein [Streptomyces sp. NBC_01497]
MSFEHPDAWHAPATYWFWQRVPSKREIREQLDTLAGAGFGSFQIQTRLSFPREEYLGDAYLAAVRLAADEAAARGLMMGLYDEYNWLSGHAGGRTVAGRDELRERHMFFSTSASTSASAAPADDGAAECAVDGIRAKDVDHLLGPGKNWVFEDAEIRWDQWEIVAALAHPEGSVTDADSVVDVTAHAYFADTGGSGCRVRVPLDVVGPGRAVTVFVAARCASSRMINYLLPEAAERFLDVGYEPYAAALGHHLGSTVSYVFFDQPHACFYGWRQQDEQPAHLTSSLMYAPAVVPLDRRELLALARDIGPATAAWRCAFFERYAALGIDAFFGTLSRWCGSHGVALSGHEVLGFVSSWNPTDTIITEDTRTNFGSDYFGLDRHRDLTAVDARNEHPQISAKFGDSMARSNGRSGCLVEQYFARTETGSHFAEGRWELTLGELRNQTVRHHLLGARQLLTHAFWLTDGRDTAPEETRPGTGDGATAVDAGPPAVFTDPAFDFPPGVNFEPWFSHHLAFAEESGRLSEFLDGADPLNEIALLYPLRTAWAGGPAHPYGAHFAFWAEHLARAGYDFSVVDERDVRDGRLRERCATLILPGVSVVADIATVEALAKFTADGGTVLASGPLPTAAQNGGSGIQESERELAGRVADLVGGPRAAHWPDLPSGEDVDARLTAAVTGHPQIESDADVWSVRRRDDDGFRIALFNDGAGRRVVSVRPASLPAGVTRWEAATGLRSAPREVTESLTLTLEAGELVCLHLTEGTGEVRGTPATLVLDQGWTLQVAGVPRQPVDVYRGWEQQGLPAFAGTGEYRTVFDLPLAGPRSGAGSGGAEAGGEEAGGGNPAEEWPQWELHLPGVEASAEAELNGVVVGRWGWGPFRCVFPAGVLRRHGNELTVKVASTAANRYAPAGRPSGLVRPPRLRPKL